MQRAIITVVGKDTIGIIAGVCTYLADNRINILDISQTIVQGYFSPTSWRNWAGRRSASRSGARKRRSST